MDKYNKTCMKENNGVGNHIPHMQLIVKKLYDVGHPITNKMQVTTILNSLPLSWDNIVTSLTHNGNEVTMTSLPIILVLEGEKERMNYLIY